MYIIRKSLAVMLTLLLVLGMFALPAYAAETSSDGLAVTLTTDKKEYARGETITATLTVKNTNTVAVKNVTLESMIPAGYVLAQGDQTALQVNELAAGQTVTLTVRLVPQQAEEPTTNGNTPPKGDDPTTGDPFPVELLAVVLVLAMIGLGLLVVKYKAWKRVLSLVLCAAMLVSLVAGVPFEVFAAEEDAKLLNLSTTVKVDGKPVELRAKVTYDLPDLPEPVYHTVSFDLDYKDAPQIESRQVLHGETVQQPEGVVREGYKFAYWCVKIDTGVKMISLSDPVTEDLTLYARWVREGADTEITYTTYYNISFGIPAGYTEDDISATFMPEAQVIHEGALVYAMPTPYREGYTFVAWCSDSSLAKPISTEAIVTGDMVLYPLMVEGGEPETGMDTINYVADEDVTDVHYSVTVKAPALQAVMDDIVWVDVAEGDAQIEFNVTDNGDGTYTLTARDGLVMGKTYQLRAMDRERLPKDSNVAESYIRFYHNGELQSIDVRYYNIFTLREEVNNMRLANGMVFLPIDQVQGLDLEAASSLYTLQTEKTGSERIDPNENEGTFTYTGSKKLTVGDIVAVYEGDASVEEEYRTRKTVGSAKNTAFLKILAVDGNTCSYGSPDIFDTLYIPEVLPIPLAADTDGNAEDQTVTIANSNLDYRYFPVETMLDENTTADVGDFIAFYSGTVDEPGQIRYAKITSVLSQGDMTTIGFEPASLEDIQADVDSFVHNEVPAGLTEGEIIEMENQAVQQALDSGFAEDAAALAIQEKLDMDEAPVWGQRYALTRSQAQAFGYDPEIDDVEIDAGTYAMMFTFDPPQVTAEITENLQRITTIKDGLGLRLAFGVYVGIGVEVVNVWTQEVDQSFTLDMYVTMEQELAIGMDVGLDANVDLYLGFIPTDAWARLDITFDVGSYTGIGVVAIGGTEVDHDKEYLWDKLVKDDGSSGAFTSSESIADQLNEMLSQGNTSFFDQHRDEEGRSTLIEEYRNMLKREVDYVDILAIGRSTPFKIKIIPETPVAEVAINPQFVIAAKLNVVLGVSAELMDVKQYSYALFMSLSNGANAWANSPVNKQTPYHRLNMMMFGNIGVRAGVRLDLSIGVPVSGRDFFSKHFKLCSLGTMIEMGFYVDLYGFGYYHYEKNRETGKTVNPKAGAFHLEIGFYMDIDIYASALLDLVNVTFHVLEMQVPIYKFNKTRYIYDVGLIYDTQTLYSKDRSDLKWYKLNSQAFAVDSFDIKTGDLYRQTLSADQFAVVIPEEYQDLIEYMEYDVNGNFRQAFWLKPDAEQRNLEIKLDIVLKASMSHARANTLDSLYDLIDTPCDTMTIKWSRGKDSAQIQYESKGPVYYGYGSYTYCTGHGSDYVTIATVTEGDAIPKLDSINHLAPEVPGMDFCGWQVRCSEYEELDGKFITDISELQGYTVSVYDIQLHPQYVPRDDTEYTVRYWVPTLDDPEEYEIFREDTLTGRTHTSVNCLDHYLKGYDGLQIDYDKLPIQKTVYNKNGELIYIDFDVIIRHDGSTVIDLYYKRDNCMVTVEANNPEFDYYGSVASTNTAIYSFGQAVPDPGYRQTQIPGYTFLGWSTTADGSSGIMDNLPDSLEFTQRDKQYGLTYYAIWKPDTVICQVSYYLLDPYGVYQFQGSEDHELAYGTRLYTTNLKPVELELPEDAFGQYAEASFTLDGVTHAYDKNYIYHTGGLTDINVYYSRSYTKVYFDYVPDYYIQGDTIILPAAEKTGYRFLGWRTNIYGDDTLYAAGQSLKLTKREYFFTSVFVEADDVKYTVEHYLQQEDGTYSDRPTDVQVFYGTTGSTVTPATKEYTGYETPVARKLTIQADGSAVAQYYYARKIYEVIVDYQIEGENLRLRGHYTSQYRYGTPFNLMDPYDNPLSIQREGYRIAGWYLADEALNPNQTLLDPADYEVSGDALFCQKDLVFKPMWEKVPYEYRVEHYLEQPNGSYTLQQTDRLTGYMNDVVTAKTVLFTGFTFDETNGDNVCSGTVTTDGSLVLKLHYSRNSYQVKWYAYDGTTVLATTEVKYKDTITPPETYDADLTRHGYTMTGWKDADYGAVTTAGASFTAADYGLWTANPYQVAFTANGGQGTMENQSFTYDQTQSLTANGFTRPGYAFAGWSYTPTGSVLFADREQVTGLAASGVVTLFAIWNAKTDTPYAVEHYGEALDGGWKLLSGESFTGITDTTATAAASSFTGFSYNADAHNVTKGNIAGDGSLVLKLYYSRNSYTLSWLDYDGTELASQSVLFEAPIAVPDDVTPQRMGYRFLGWNVSGTMPAKNTTFSAKQDGKWSANTYTVSFDANGGQGTMENQSFTYDQAQFLQANSFTRKGYIFAGWSTEPGGKAVYADQQQIENLLTSGNAQLYAVWTAGDGYGYRVEHYVQQPDGSYRVDTTASFSGVMDSEVSAASIRIQGYTFNADHPDNVLSGTINAEGTLVLKLHYDLQSYTATLVDENGAELACWKVPYGGAVTVPADAQTPVREGYTFTGWADLGIMPAKDMTYSVADYGSWKANTYTVRFDANGGEGKMDDQTFTYDKAQTLSANSFQKTGYTFAGWSLNREGAVKYADQAKITNLAASGTVTLYAQWNAGNTSYKVICYGEKPDGTGFEKIKTEERSGKTGSEVSAADIAIDGFTYDAANGDQVTSGIIAGDGSLVLKLYYTRNSYTLTLDLNGESMKQSVMNWDTGLKELTDFDIPDQTFTVKHGQTLAEYLTDIKVSVLMEEGYWTWSEELQEDVYIDPVYEQVAFETAFPGYTFGSWEGLCDTMPTKDLTLTAQWDPITITVTFHPGSYQWFDSELILMPVTETFAYGSEIEFPDYFAMDNCTITGWYAGESQWNYPFIVEPTLSLVYGYFESFEDVTEVTIAPYWVVNSSVATITFNGNGGEGSMAPMPFDASSGYGYGLLPRNKFTREGYVFTGWNTAADGSGEAVPVDWFNLTSDTTLYAQWEEKE